MLPKLMLGTSPFIGAAQFGAKALKYKELFFDRPENITRLFIHSAKLGVKAVQLIAYDPLIRAMKEAEAAAGKFFVVATIVENFDSSLDKISSLEPEFIAPHAQFCDMLDPRLNEWIDAIKETGAKPAASTHTPGNSIPKLDELGFEAYLAPLNPLGYGMKPDVESTLKAIKNTKSHVIAIKPLAAGKLVPDKTLFDYIYKYADSTAVGIVSEEEMAETYSHDLKPV